MSTQLDSTRESLALKHRDRVEAGGVIVGLLTCRVSSAAVPLTVRPSDAGASLRWWV